MRFYAVIAIFMVPELHRTAGIGTAGIAKAAGIQSAGTAKNAGIRTAGTVIEKGWNGPCLTSGTAN